MLEKQKNPVRYRKYPFLKETKTEEIGGKSVSNRLAHTYKP